MKVIRSMNRTSFIGNDEKGVVMILVLSFMSLMILSSLSLSLMVQRDMRLIRRAKEKEQARLIAEAGINEAFARIRSSGFEYRSDFETDLDTGSFEVTYSEDGGRYLITSVGETGGGITATVYAEILDTTPEWASFFSGAGNNIRIYSFIAGADIEGDIHANNNVYLSSGPIIAYLNIEGSVSATGIVKEGTRYNYGGGFWPWQWDTLDNHVGINEEYNDDALVYDSDENYWDDEMIERISFPEFNYNYCKQQAIESGDYYEGDQEFDDQTLTPGNGIVYVDGDVTFVGQCTLNGGIIADNITIGKLDGWDYTWGQLQQNKIASNRNVIVAKEGDVKVRGRLYTEEALVYAEQDIRSFECFAGSNAELEINGIMMAKRDVRMWNFITLIEYKHKASVPYDLLVQ